MKKNIFLLIFISVFLSALLVNAQVNKAPATAKAVDLGVSVKWANMNIGATKVTQYGNFYAWGETKPQPDKRYDWTSYKWCNGSEDTMTKYSTEYDNGEIDGKLVLDFNDDAASVNWGNRWRMPTYKEFDELWNNCYCVWTSNYNKSGIAGYIVYKPKSVSDKGKKVYKGKIASDKYDLNSIHVFFPETDEPNISQGGYWSSSLDEPFDYCARGWFLYPDSIYFPEENPRCNGRFIRAVYK